MKTQYRDTFHAVKCPHPFLYIYIYTITSLKNLKDDTVNCYCRQIFESLLSKATDDCFGLGVSLLCCISYGDEDIMADLVLYQHNRFSLNEFKVLMGFPAPWLVDLSVTAARLVL